MKLLLVQHNEGLSDLWSAFLRREGVDVTQAYSQADAIRLLRFTEFDALVLDVILPDGGAISISDYATYRQPDIPIIAVSTTNFFTDGSIFDMIPNARSLMHTPVSPSDLVAVVDHYATPEIDRVKSA